MEEKLLTGRRHGMAVLLLILLLYVLAIAGVIVGAALADSAQPTMVYEGFYVDAPVSTGRMVGGVALIVVCVIWLCLGWIFLCGLKVLKPQEALVLTLFGKYIGTLKGEGFYYVNPFCSAVNPAAKTRLNQSCLLYTSDAADEL